MTKFEEDLRAHLLSPPHTPQYCGGMPCDQQSIERTTLIDGQFECACGWRSSYDEAFITEYQTKVAALESD